MIVRAVRTRSYEENRELRRVFMEKFFHLKENGTTVSTEIIAGLTTFFAMSYIIVVNPSTLSQSGMEGGAVALACLRLQIHGLALIFAVSVMAFNSAHCTGGSLFSQ